MILDAANVRISIGIKAVNNFHMIKYEMFLKRNLLNIIITSLNK